MRLRVSVGTAARECGLCGEWLDMSTPTVTVTAIAPWFGSNRNLAHEVGRHLAGCKWVGVPFAGGMSELLHITARTMLVSDMHAHVLNLAAVVADADLNARLRARLNDLPVHPDVLTIAQRRCREREKATALDRIGGASEPPPADLDWAANYFVCAWMSRNGNAGTANEFSATQSIRWTATGGDSAIRFRNATESLAGWSDTMRRCTFTRLDVFQFLINVKDHAGHGLYLDPPFPDVGDDYKFRFGEAQQVQLARSLGTFKNCKVVCRFYDHPLVQRLYPEELWTWHRPVGGKTQTGKNAPEVLLVNRSEQQDQLDFGDPLMTRKG